MVSYAFDDGPVKTVDLLSGELWPEEFIDAYFNDEVIMHAHNAVFERLALAKVIAPIPIARWECSLVKCAYAGIQLSLDKASKMLGLSQTKLASTGADCIKYFSIPCKPTKVNGQRTRNYPEHNPEKWADYLKYNAQDVETERAIAKRLEDIILPEREKQLYILDQEINDRGIMVDLDFVNKAAELNGEYKQNLVQSTKDDLGIEKPNSVAQIKRWCADQGYPVDSVTKDDVARILARPRRASSSKGSYGEQGSTSKKLNKEVYGHFEHGGRGLPGTRSFPILWSKPDRPLGWPWSPIA